MVARWLPIAHFCFFRGAADIFAGRRRPSHNRIHLCILAEHTTENTSESQPDATLPMDITVRVEVQYHAPANAVTRDVLEMFRSTTWVRFMMRYVSPRLKTSSPADQAILDQLESQEAAEVHEGEECVICMSENPCDGHVALPCGHSFHYPCISSWLQNQSTCPVCRFQFPKAFTGKYAVQKLKSSMVLSEEQGKMPRAELLALDIGKQVVRAVVSVTLVKVAAGGDDEEFPCELSAWMLDPSTGQTFSELDCV
ncbi:Ring finger domain [Phytophthora infestans]|uniref:Ring finger domain n=1 Tax=Phytophthora infestans TaxID=4787 RepID=A0A833TB31_PHYIN|nr:Ring finger domain [Phytophthora infestans]KAF4145869.1 Ring finger domain [Phytophthora infestans]